MNKNHLKFIDKINTTKFKKLKVKMKSEIKIGTDCSGIEAPIQALELLNIKYKHIFSCDNDKHVIKNIEGNYKPEILYEDIFNRDYDNMPYVDGYIAGFPCTTFSTLGKMKGFEEKNGTIFFCCYKTIKVIEPKFFILENVKALVTHNKGKTFESILHELHKLEKYNIYWKIFNTCEYGIPQKRERVYIIGIKKEYDKNFVYPEPIKLEVFVNDIITTEPVDNKFGYLTDHKSKLLNELVDNNKIDKLDKHWSVNLNVSHQKMCYPKLDICPCLLAGNGGDCIFYLTSIKRRYTPREYLNLQGFNTTFKQCVSNSKMYKQVGNSMSVNVLCFIYKSIFESIY